jgi:uncharacterized RDD family membrane protein YckC
MTQHDPYQAPGASLRDPVPATEALQLAERGTRLGAVILDSLLNTVLVLPFVIAAMFYSGVFSGSPPPWLVEAMRGGLSLAFQLGIIVFGFLVFLLIQGYPLARYGQTWAKRWLGIRIVDLEGRKPEFWRLLLLRYGVGQVLGVVPCIGPLYGLTDACFVFRDDRRCVHDLLAGTRVVQGAPPEATH